MAYQAVPLILQETSVERGFGRGAPIRAGTTLVAATADGEAVALGRRRTVGESLSARYRTLYVVDVTDHETTYAEPLPGRDDIFAFQAVIDLTWRVTDPREIVLRRVLDGRATCRSYLLDLLVPVTRRYRQDDPAGAEDELNERFRDRQTELPAGITIFRTSVRLTRDAGSQTRLQEQALRSYHGERQQLERDAEIQRAYHTNMLAGITQQARLRLEQERREALRLAIGGHDALLIEHLTMHPDDTGGVLNSIAANRTADREAQLRLIEMMISQGLIQPADANTVLARLAGITIQPAIAPPPHTRHAPPALPGPPAALPPGRSVNPAGGPAAPPWTGPPGHTGPAGPTGSAGPGGSWPPDDGEPPIESATIDASPSNVGGWRPVRRPGGAPTPAVDRDAEVIEVEEDEYAPFPAEAEAAGSAETGQDGAHVVGWKTIGRPQP
jgi:hypothetical protein